MTNSASVKTILVLAANPINQARLRLDEEVREIDEGLRRSKRRDCFKLEQRWAVGTDALRRALLDFEPQIVHFCGHGSDDSGLILEDEAGQVKLVSTQALANLFELCKEHVECIVLNACYSEKQANAIAQHIGYVIGMSEAIGDKAAIRFAVGFYDALGAGRSVEDAHKFGCSAIQMENIPQYLTPTLKKNPEAASNYIKNALLKRPTLLTNRISYALKNEWPIELLIPCLIIFIAAFMSWGGYKINTQVRNFSDDNFNLYGYLNAWNGSITIQGISIPNWTVTISALFIPILRWLNTSSILQVKPLIYIIIATYGIIHVSLLIILLIFYGRVYAGSIITLLALCFILAFLIKKS